MISGIEATRIDPAISPKPEARIRLVDVHLAFGPQRVLRGVNLEIFSGETLVVVGRSGEGKSVLLKVIDGILKPDKGEVWVEDQRIDTLPPRALNEFRRRIAMVFQGAALFDSMTVEENVAFPYRERRLLADKSIRERVVENLRRVHLVDPGVLRKKPAELSGGMKKRVGVARALSMEPEIILWDEPTTGLDPVTADAINDLILEVQQSTHATSVVVTHDMASVFKVGNRVAMLNQGVIVYTGTVEETRETENAMVSQFVQGRAQGPLTEGLPVG
ncbi:MAG: L-cystine import ATP-binding protein TcyN [Candidatus Hinthialibacteria bacterium OLB16]|nr:MAG: L-cystine import ATP-binding protein TcyN [Candidatus Hinthialibacteria bacterium OLB16]